ncbi:hypothetical protein HDV02_000532 [Globomyces sp. JEL0801]|nr:hypothetical protein HDV02_000532 [Globomyces sp. JEL0801]
MRNQLLFTIFTLSNVLAQILLPNGTINYSSMPTATYTPFSTDHYDNYFAWFGVVVSAFTLLPFLILGGVCIVFLVIVVKFVRHMNRPKLPPVFVTPPILLSQSRVPTYQNGVSVAFPQSRVCVPTAAASQYNQQVQLSQRGQVDDSKTVKVRIV